MVVTTADEHSVAATAVTTEGAIAMAAKAQPDVIVTDLTLAAGPIAGRTYLTRLRAAAPDARIVIFSGRSLPDRGHLQGADAYLMKPADPETILRVIEGR